MTVDDPPGDRESDAGARELALAVQALERAKEAVDRDHVEADPVVPYQNARHAVHRLLRDFDLWRAGQAGELPSVVDEVGQQYADEAQIPGRGHARCDFHVDIALGTGCPQLVDDLTGDCGYIQVLPAQFAAGQAEKRLKSFKH